MVNYIDKLKIISCDRGYYVYMQESEKTHSKHLLYLFPDGEIRRYRFSDGDSIYFRSRGAAIEAIEKLRREIFEFISIEEFQV